MTYRVLDTAEWPIIKIAPYLPKVLTAFEKLQQRYSDDLTVESLFAEYLRGEKRLWLVLDEAGAFVSFAMTQIRTIDATGKRIATVMDLAGTGSDGWADVLRETLEAWAEQNGADYTAIEGREGWGVQAKRHGYRKYAVLWRKPIARAGNAE